METHPQTRKLTVESQTPIYRLLAPFLEERNAGIQIMKKGKAVRLNNSFVEKVRHFGP